MRERLLSHLSGYDSQDIGEHLKNIDKEEKDRSISISWVEIEKPRFEEHHYLKCIERRQAIWPRFNRKRGRPKKNSVSYISGKNPQKIGREYYKLFKLDTTLVDDTFIDNLSELNEQLEREYEIVTDVDDEIVAPELFNENISIQETEETMRLVKLGKAILTLKSVNYITASSRALGALSSKYFLVDGFDYETYTKLFASTVFPIIDYASGVLGYKPYDNIERVQYRAIRTFMGVRKCSPNRTICGDMGWTPVYIHRQCNIE
ncbi:unnamed protein product [Mytilus coruscus]|uniref:Uncharacterized protein n=1 Tax=Mytilus coruscus TaxID=42192 RepID=A0A6J8CG53_MYTCO|nr:unnamed protein product [Mytilus coruscus]